jgi:hypothetical protein
MTPPLEQSPFSAARIRACDNAAHEIILICSIDSTQKDMSSSADEMRGVGRVPERTMKNGWMSLVRNVRFCAVREELVNNNQNYKRRRARRAQGASTTRWTCL